METLGRDLLPVLIDRFRAPTLYILLGSHPVPIPPALAPWGALCHSLTPFQRYPVLSSSQNSRKWPAFEALLRWRISAPAEQPGGTHRRLMRAWAAGEVPEHEAIFRLAQMPSFQLKERAWWEAVLPSSCIVLLTT